MTNKIDLIEHAKHWLGAENVNSNNLAMLFDLAEKLGCEFIGNGKIRIPTIINNNNNLNISIIPAN